MYNNVQKNKTYKDLKYHRSVVKKKNHKISMIFIYLLLIFIF